MAAVSTHPIQTEDLEAVARFLHQNLNSRIPPEMWRESLSHEWAEERPNHGFLLRANGELAGVLCAIYSDQEVFGRIERFCNPHSWCVLDAYRKQSVDLVVQVLRQKGLHFTMLSPNPAVADVFRFFRFKKMDSQVWVAPNIPLPAPSSPSFQVSTDHAEIATLLANAPRRNFEAHRGIPWLDHVLFGDSESYCHVIFKRRRWKRLPCADVLYMSDPGGFRRHYRGLASFLIRSRGIVWTRAETRLSGFRPTPSFVLTESQPKLFLSNSLNDSAVQNIYTELVALDL